ncbi:hypothetical protein BASA81_001040 [Batrachochytrium salamandrivorans]|nr:hypothetical protein BASA81_001040 [Batrachochytrium salamandrivorans]
MLAPPSSSSSSSRRARADNNWILSCLAVFVCVWMLSIGMFLYSHQQQLHHQQQQLQQQQQQQQQVQPEVVKLLDQNKLALSQALDAAELGLQQVTQRLKYWHLPDLETRAGLFKQPPSQDRYLLFLSDCGGFNNIRMAFEYFYMTAWLTKRTLVLPPPHSWYLIDSGPMMVMNKKQANEPRVTDYSDFFDLAHMQAAVPIISADEYRRIVQGLPKDLVNADFTTKPGREVWKQYTKDPTRHVHVAWNPLAYIVFFPTIKSVTHASSKLVHHRTPVEFTGRYANATSLSFPSCESSSTKAWDANHMRYLGQMACYGAFQDEQLGKAFKRTLRDHVHFPPIVFEIAARVVNFLGLFQYTALHVRRNDLQYKEVFMSADKLYGNIQSLLLPRETFYIATDETDPNFFDSLTLEHGHEVFKWDDFFTERGGNVLTNIHIPRKLIGCIEQVICSGGRAFMGTLESTYTSYIFRLRGYVKAPNDEVYFHTLKYSGDRDADRQVTWAKKPEKGQVYQTEHRYMWEDLNF